MSETRLDPRAAADAAWAEQRQAPKVNGSAAEAVPLIAADAARMIGDIPELVAKLPKIPDVIDPGAPLDIARLFIDRMYADISGENRTLHHHRGAFYAWSGRAYPEAEEAALRASLYDFLAGCVTPEGKAFKPTSYRVAQVIDALKAAAFLPGSIAAPAWLNDDPPSPPATDIIACANGLLHLPKLAMMQHTPRFFGHNALDFDYQPNAAAPAAWLRFLAELWPDDPASIETMQELFGYCLGAGAAQQKIFLLVGPKRSGKGTIATILRHLVGADNMTAPTLAGLGTNFGLAPLIGKTLAVIGDARLGARADQHAIAERLLSISGQDAITVDRKFRDAWTGKLTTRFIIMTNELPRLADASGALASRFIVLVLTHSFFGREDLGLSDRLLRELPGILNWSIAGWQRLQARGYFVQPQSAAEAVQQLEDLGSPISAFLRDTCHVGPQFTIEVGSLFEAWQGYCRSQGREHAGTAQTFGRDLRAACPALSTMQPREAGGRLRFYQGISLK